MSDNAENTNQILFEIKVTPGRAGVDPNAPDWEVWEYEGTCEKPENLEIYNNLTQAEAHQIAGMWKRKIEEAEKNQAES
jgi:hypothetical protein